MLSARNAPDYIGYMILHQYHLVESWHRLDETVLTGRPTRARASIRGEEEREAFLMGMFNAAMGLAPGIVKEIDLSGRRHLLDMGGGPGTWAIHFCLAKSGTQGHGVRFTGHPTLCREDVARFRVGDRVLFQAGRLSERRDPGRL